MLLAVALWFWFARGANRGWTKDRQPRQSTDPVTGLVGVSYENRFVPGVNFLGAACLASSFLFGISFMFRNKQIST